MTANHLYFLIVITLFLSGLVFVAGYFYHRGKKRTPARWEDLFARLAWVDRNAVAEVALQFAALTSVEGEPHEELEPSKLWKLVGGLHGLEMMERNGDVLIDMAAYLQRFYPEAVTIAERLRQDARELKWHVSRLKGAAQTGNLEISFPFYAQRAVLSYYVMTQRLLDLYQSADFSMLADLQRAL